jgi:thiamine biosynthesis protein ThiS
VFLSLKPLPFRRRRFFILRFFIRNPENGIKKRVNFYLESESTGRSAMSAQNIEICVNGETVACPPGQSLDVFLDEFLEGRGSSPAGVVVEINGTILKPQNFINYTLNAEDQVEIIHFVGGG